MSCQHPRRCALYTSTVLLQAALVALASEGPSGPEHHQLDHLHHRARDGAADWKPTTCGYYTGNPYNPRPANSGYACPIDTAHALWGFCRAGISATDCSYGAACSDIGSCSSICQFNTLNDGLSLLTVTCQGAHPYCSTALLISGSQTFGCLGCAGSPKTATLLVTPTFTPSSTAPTSATPATPAAASVPPSPTASQTAASPSGTSTTSSESTKAAEGTNKIGGIVGGALGGLALVCALSVAVGYIVKRRRADAAAPPKLEHDTQTLPEAVYPFASPVSTPRYAYAPPPLSPPSPQPLSSDFAVELPSNPQTVELPTSPR